MTGNEFTDTSFETGQWGISLYLYRPEWQEEMPYTRL